MQRTLPSGASPLRLWSAWIPILIPVFLLALGIRSVAIQGLVSQPDEGTEAHLFQLLMPVQLLVMGIFAVTWLPPAPRAALTVLALQVILVIPLLAALASSAHAPLGCSGRWC